MSGVLKGIGIGCGVVVAGFSGLMVLFLVVGVVLTLTEKKEPPKFLPAPKAVVKAPKEEIDPAKKEAAETLVSNLLNSGYVRRVQKVGSSVKVTVNPIFATLPVKEKTQVAEVVFLWGVYQGTGDILFVRFLDSTSDKEIGKYSGSGLQWY